MNSSSSSCSLPIYILIKLIIIIFTLPLTKCSPSSAFYNNNITLCGDATFITNNITNTTTIALTHQQPSSFGCAFYVYPVRFLDSETKASASFATWFSFTITSVSPPGEGMSFLISSHLDSFNQENGFMGLPELSLSLEDSFFAVEFDTKFDPYVGDINGNHVGVDVDSYTSVVSADGFAQGVEFSSGKMITAWIEYKSSEKMIRVWISYSNVKPENPVLFAHIDLGSHMKKFMHVGFVGFNGKGSVLHEVDRWRFKTFEFESSNDELEPVGVGVGEEDESCVACMNEEAKNRNVNSSLFQKKGNEKVLMIVIVSVAGFVSSLVVAVVGVLIWQSLVRVQQQKARHVTGIELKKGPVKLSLKEIKSATGGFSKNRIIGQGASATVYKGVLDYDLVVAVKRFNHHSKVDILTPFTTEFATMARSLRHKNLVELLGWCCESRELILVYEYMPNGSLDQILYKGSGNVSLLTWEQRMNIVLGIASCLTYLHEECDKQIIHRDVKACNVMLDSDFTAKLGDFGLAEVYERGHKPRKSTLPAGTMGYLAPEYVYSGVPTVKSDVYSFGVVVMEVVSGRRPVGEDGRQLVDWAWALWQKGRLVEAVDGRLMGKYSRKDMERMLKVALCCVHPDSGKRPTVRKAAMMLREELPVTVLPTHKPSLKLQFDLPAASQSFLDSGSDYAPDSPWATPKTHLSKA